MVTEDKLRSIFGSKGQITDVQLKFTKEGVFRGFAFIGFHDEASVEEAIKYFDKSSISTNKISVQSCAALGDENKPQSWSKYARDSSAFKNALKVEKEKSKGAENECKKKEKLKKFDATKELLDKYKDDPLFDEFLQVHSSKKAQTLLRELKSTQNAKTSDNIDKDDPNITELHDNKISDEDYLNLLKKKAPRKKTEKKPKVKLDLFHIKLTNLPYTFKKRDLKHFFRPLAPYSIRIPRNIKGIAFVGFKDEKKFNKALLKDRSIMKGKQVILSQVHKGIDKDNQAQNGHKKWASQEEALKNEESVAESGRIFLRNLSYTTTENDVRKEFEKYGPIAELNLPVDSETRQMKGFGFVTFVMPEHAVKAYAELDGNILHGRMLHLLPGKLPHGDQNDDKLENSTNFKKKQSVAKKTQANSTHNWNTLFLGANAVADVIANTYDTTKERVLSDEGSGAAVRLALGETQIVANTRKYLEEHGIVLDAFSNPDAKRSATIILVKNLPANTSGKEINAMFQQYGVIGRFVFPPSGITAIVEFIEPSEARKAFVALAYKNFKGVPLYLEWAPENVTDDVKKATVTASKKSKDEEKPAYDECDRADEEPEENTTLHVKNLDISVTDEELREHFSACGKINYANIATKKDPANPSKSRSMGYGFVRFLLKASADKALKTLQFSSLSGKTIELKRSERTLPNDLKPKKKTSKGGKQNGTKILVKNIPFQAKRKEITQLFKTFGELKAVRLPKKIANDVDSHRGFAFVDYSTNSDAKNAFEALCQSTHLYGRRLILEWAQTVEDVDGIRKRTADHFHEVELTKKSKKGLIDIENMQ